MTIDDYIPTEYLDKEKVKELVSEIKEKFSKNKNIPTVLELSFYIAISKFPELQNIPIVICKKGFDLTLQAQPASNFLFTKKENRVYKINVNNDHKRAHGVIFEELPFDAQVGIMAHELTHILSYIKKSNLQMALFAISFLGIKFRRIIEKNTDQEVISRGLGWQLYEWADFAMYRSLSPRRHKYYKLGYYLSPEDIIEDIKTYPNLYKSFNK